MAYSHSQLLDALEHTWGQTSAFAASLTDDDWELPTGCPGWTVKDNLSHLVGLERAIMGEPDPDHELPALPHVRDEVGRYMEVHVDVRRSVSPTDVLAEFDEVRVRRMAQLRETVSSLDDEIDGPLGSRSAAGRLLPIRVFDCWAHDQDMRRAVGRLGNQSGLAAEISIDRMVRGARYNLPKRLGLTSEVTALFEITDPQPRTVVARIGPDEAELLASVPQHVDVRLELDLDTFVVLGCGREGYPDVIARGQVRCTGDAQLADRIVKAMPVTP